MSQGVTAGIHFFTFDPLPILFPNSSNVGWEFAWIK